MTKCPGCHAPVLVVENVATVKVYFDAKPDGEPKRAHSCINPRGQFVKDGTWRGK